MIYREKGTVEAWQVPQEKDRRKALPSWVADWHPGRVPSEPALVMLGDNAAAENTGTGKVDAMSGDWLVLDGAVVRKVDASAFADRYEPAE